MAEGVTARGGGGGDAGRRCWAKGGCWPDVPEPGRCAGPGGPRAGAAAGAGGAAACWSRPTGCWRPHLRKAPPAGGAEHPAAGGGGAGRMGAPAHGVVNAAVEMARRGQADAAHLAGLVNAVLAQGARGAPLAGPRRGCRAGCASRWCMPRGREVVTAIEAVQATAPPLDLTLRAGSAGARGRGSADRQPAAGRSVGRSPPCPAMPPGTGGCRMPPPRCRCGCWTCSPASGCWTCARRRVARRCNWRRPGPM